MTNNARSDLYDFVHDDCYIVKLLQEFYYLANEKKERTQNQADTSAPRDEAGESF